MHVRTKVAGVVLGITAGIVGVCFMPADTCSTSKNPTVVWGFMFLLLIGALSFLFSWAIHGFISLFKIPEKIREARETRKQKRIDRVEYPEHYARLRRNTMNNIKGGVIASLLMAGVIGGTVGLCWLVGYILKIFIC